MKLSESFFAELGFDNMTDIFWEKSMIEKPTDREVVCHASAEDFYAKDDFRYYQTRNIKININHIFKTRTWRSVYMFR